MKNVKAIIIVVIAVLLVGSLVYLTLLIQDGSNPLGMFGIRASNPQDEADPYLTENDVTGDTSPDTTADVGTTEPSTADPLLAYNSTSPTVTPSGSATPSTTLAVSNSPTPSVTPTPTIVNVVLETTDPTPTTIQSLPVSGITDQMDKFLIGGGILIMLGHFL